MNSSSLKSKAFGQHNRESKYDIFVSYARKDGRYAHELSDNLKGLKTAISFSVFIDKEELRAGDDLKNKIEGALHSSSIFIIIATPYYFASDWAFPREFPLIKTAVVASAEKRIITLVYEECDFLLEYHRLNRYLFANFSRTRKRSYNKLISDLYKTISTSGT